MKQTKLIQLLRSFSASEMKSMGIFLRSPYFNTSDKLIKFYDLLNPHFPDFDTDKISKEKIYTRLHPKAAYNDQTMRELISALFKLAEKFIAHEQFSHNDLEVSKQKYEWLEAKQIGKLQEQEIEHSEKLLNTYKIKDGNYYYYQWLTGYNKLNYYSTTLRDQEIKMLRGLDMTAHLRALDKYYLIKFFTMRNYLLNFSRIYNQPFDSSIFENCDTLVLKYINGDNTTIDLLYNIVNLNISGNESYYFELKNKFFVQDPHSLGELNLDIAINLENYCIKRIREGDDSFLPELMEVFMFDIKHGLMYINGKLPYLFYQNVVIIGLDNGNVEWVAQFVEEYKSKLEEEHREEIYSYCKAFVLFEQKKLKDALKLALNISPSLFFNKIEIKGLIARIHFDLKMFDQLEVVLETYKHALKDGRLTEARKESISNFISMMRQLVKLYHNPKNEDKLKFHHDLETTKKVSYKRWFKDKIIELKRPK